MSVVIEVEIDAQQAEDFFRYAGYKTRRTMGRPLNLVADLMRGIMFEQWATEGEVFPSPDFFEWAPLADSTIDQKGHDRILFETGALFDASLDGVHVHGNEVYLEIDRYTDDGEWLPGLHQEGTARMPPRPLWETTEEFENQVQIIFWEWLVELKNTNRARVGLSDIGLGSIKVQPTYLF